MRSTAVANYDCIVVGAGFYGCYMACHFGALGYRTCLLEERSEIMSRASRNNQARVHAGYHYPRDLLTAARAFNTQNLFRSEFSEAISDNGHALYAIARKCSKVSASKFQTFFERLGVPIKAGSSEEKQLFDMRTIEQVFSCEEYTFDSEVLSQIMKRRIQTSGVHLKLQSKVETILPSGDKATVVLADGTSLAGRQILNVTYSNLTEVLPDLMDDIELKHESAELVLVAVPEELASRSITVMDGPFFSILPSQTNMYSKLSHVRYSPRLAWRADTVVDVKERLSKLGALSSNYELMLRDASRYIPIMREAKFQKSIFETKTIPAFCESNDARPILLRQSGSSKNVYSILGSKIDNVYDILGIQTLFEDRTPS